MARPRPRFGGRQRLGDGAEPAGEGRAFARSEDGAGDAEAPESGGPGVRGGGQAPDADGGGHAAAHAPAVENEAPDRVADHVGDGETGNDEAVLFGVQMRLAQDDRREDGERVAVDVADERDQPHRNATAASGLRGSGRTSKVTHDDTLTEILINAASPGVRYLLVPSDRAAPVARHDRDAHAGKGGRTGARR